MTELSSELRNWLLSLGFDDRSVTSDRIETELNRLCPPEMRDIWRSVMNHTLPVHQVRYIKKILLLNELKRGNGSRRQGLTIKKNIDTIQKLKKYIEFEDVFRKMNNCLNAVREVNLKIKDQKQEIFQLENTLKNLKKEIAKRTDFETLMVVKSNSHVKVTNKLFELHMNLLFVNSFWNVKKNSDNSSNTLHDILPTINEYCKRRSSINEMNLLEERQLLMEGIMKLTAHTSIAELHKLVIEMLRETLSSLLKLCDHVVSKQEMNNTSKIESKIIEWRKNFVELFMENFERKQEVDKMQETFQNKRAKLFSVLMANSGDSCDYLETWLDSECLKQRLTTRMKFLKQQEEHIKAVSPVGNVVDIKEEFDEEKFSKIIKDIENHTSRLEEEISNNMFHISDEPVNMFINYQKYCKNAVAKLVEEADSLKLKDLTAKLMNSFQNEILSVQKLNLSDKLAATSDQSTAKNNSNDEVLTDYQIREFTKMCSFYIHLVETHDNIVRKLRQIPSTTGMSIKEKNAKIEKDELVLLDELNKRLEEVKINLDSVEEFAKICSNRYHLWSMSSPNDVVPKQMMAGDRPFIEWQKRFVNALQFLRKQEQQLSAIENDE